jgi:hypothetical protein
MARLIQPLCTTTREFYLVYICEMLYNALILQAAGHLGKAEKLLEDRVRGCDDMQCVNNASLGACVWHSGDLIPGRRM